VDCPPSLEEVMSAIAPKYEDALVVVDLHGSTGNAYYILGKTVAELTAAGATEDERDTYQEDATSSDYEHLLAVTREWVTLVTV
jgi:hypothetical protein